MTLQDHFQNLRKTQLQDIMTFFGVPVKASLHKAELVEVVCEYISADPRSWMLQLMDRDMALLKELIKNGPDKSLYIDYHEFPTLLEALSLIESDQSDENFCQVRISRGLYDVVTPYVDSVIIENENNGAYEAQNELFGYLNLYGIISMEALVGVIASNHEISSQEEADSLVMKMSNNALIKVCQLDLDGKIYLYTPFVYDAAEVAAARKDYAKELEYKVFSREEAVMAGQNSPHCTYASGSQEGKKLKSMLKALGYNANETQKIMHEIWMSSQFTMDDSSAEAIYNCVARKQDLIRSFSLYKDCIDTITAYANILPKWILKGHSAQEAGVMQISIKVDDDGFEAISSQLDALSKLYGYGMAVKPVRSDDRCPCGSGLSYRNCHGRHLS